MVATGRAEVMVDPIMALWDAAPLQPILEEAGGTFTDWQGNPTLQAGEGVATNGLLLEEVLGCRSGVTEGLTSDGKRGDDGWSQRVRSAGEDSDGISLGSDVPHSSPLAWQFSHPSAEGQRVTSSAFGGVILNSASRPCRNRRRCRNPRGVGGRLPHLPDADQVEDDLAEIARAADPPTVQHRLRHVAVLSRA